MIRPITLEDGDAYVRLATQLGYPVALEHAHKRLAAEAHDARFRTLVYDHPVHGVLAWLSLRIDEPAYRSAYASVTGLVVDEAHRGRGYGAELLAAGEEWLRTQGLTNVLVRSNLKREAAHRFYLREGYGEFKRQVVFQKSLS